jgi:Cell division GTPase
LIISNDKLRDEYGNMKLTEAFMKADDVLKTAAKGIAEIITVTGYVNVDFEDVSTVMRGSGKAIMGSAKASGEDRAKTAIEEALHSPLLNDSNIAGAKNILIYITSGSDEVSLDEVVAITEHVQDICGNTSDVIWGNGIDENLGDAIAVTLIATGFDNEKVDAPIGEIETAAEKKVFSIENETRAAERKENVFKTPEKKKFDLNNDVRTDDIEDEIPQPCKPIESVRIPSERTVHTISNAQPETEKKSNNIAEKADEASMAANASKPEEKEATEESIKPIIHTLIENDDLMVVNIEPVKEEKKPEPESNRIYREDSVIKVKKYDNPFKQNDDDSNDFEIVSRKSISQIAAEEESKIAALETLVAEHPNSKAEIDSSENLRKQRLKALSINYNTSKGLEQLESQPAYMRRNVAIETHEEDLSTYSGTKNGLKADNPFLNDNVD